MEPDRNDHLPDTGRSVHLSASAGSGKTRALKDRCLALLDVLDRRGLSIDQAVAITFTDKAAAEIKERVMHGLPEAMLKKIIRGRQDLRISTIHSFCMNLLKRYPLEAGLPPDFGVLDERDRASRVQRAIEDTLEEMDREQEVMAPLRAYTADELIGTIDALLSLRTRLKRLEIDAGMGTGRAAAELAALLSGDEWRETLGRMELLLRSQGAYHEECLGREHLALAAAKTPETAFPIAAALGPVYFTRDGKPAKKAAIAKKYFTGADRKPYEDAYFAVQDLLARFQDLHARLLAGRESMGMLILYQRAEERYQKQKLREGLLDFDDLEIYAYRLLRSTDSPDILYWLDRKILHFLVDEFQDTSDIQWAILDRLTEEFFAGQGADKAMQPTLFVVGDNKQSIYRFREANYHLIENIRKKMESLPERMRDIRTLDTNYRSVPEVVGTANRVFAKLWGAEYQPSEVERKEHRGSVRLIELLAPPDGAPPGPTEAEVLAAEL
jgi:ATP-dependent helicase/nuclease subunit A